MSSHIDSFMESVRRFNTEPHAVSLADDEVVKMISEVVKKVGQWAKENWPFLLSLAIAIVTACFSSSLGTEASLAIILVTTPFIIYFGYKPITDLIKAIIAHNFPSAKS